MAKKREIEAVESILARTKTGEIKWKTGEPPALPDEGQVLTSLCAQVGGKTVRISAYRYKHYTDEAQFDWQEEVLLELGDPLKDVWWSFPRVDFRWTLLREVQRQVVGVSSWLDDFTGDDSDDEDVDEEPPF